MKIEIESDVLGSSLHQCPTAFRIILGGESIHTHTHTPSIQFQMVGLLMQNKLNYQLPPTHILSTYGFETWLNLPFVFSFSAKL